MAEVVQQRIEERIPELEQLQRVGLFTKKEVKTTALEYKLHRAIINKEDFIAYIQYEINILELVKKRRAHIHYQFKREEIEFPIIHRINSIFRRATNKWKDDVQLWLSHVAFCKKWATKGQISKVFSAMLAIHPDKSALWIMAAKSELEDRDSSESARHLFLRALRFHPNNKKVYQEYFRMELLHSEKLRRQKKDLEMAEIDLVGENGNRRQHTCIKPILLTTFSHTLMCILVFQITLSVSSLQTNFTEDSLTWDFMAKRELDAPGVGEELQTAKGRASDVNRREERCCQVYEEGVKSLNSEPMWTRYVAFCLERLKRKTNVQDLKEKLQILLSCGDTEGVASVAMAATQHYSQSVSAWSLCLQTLMQLGNRDMGKLFQDALTHVNPKESLPLWQLQVQWSAANQHANTFFLCVYQRGLLSAVAAVAMEMKELYLDWSYSTGEYKKARKTFKSLQEIRPLSKAFFTRMIEIEKKQETPKQNNLRDYYERALQEFGTTDDGKCYLTALKGTILKCGKTSIYCHCILLNKCKF
uniref:UTP6 small subunit processome component n=1 Tax=Echeneis naucrates TaxID=173247 RepID=A0A665X9D4_ECHNA